jgi:carboxypeptidase Taq
MNSKIKNYLLLEQKIEKISHLNNLLAVSHWDCATYMPEGSAASRQKEISTLSAMAFEMMKSDEVKNLINDSMDESDFLDDWQKANLKLIKKNYENSVCIPLELEIENNLASSECEFVWRKAKQENDFKEVEPYLDRVLDSVRRIASLKSDCLGKDAYDSLIDSFDPDSASNDASAVFSILKKELPELAGRIIEKQKSEKNINFSGEIGEETQKKICLKLMDYMGFDSKYGRLDKSVHPFCGGTLDDVRMTTRYDTKNFISGLLGVIHETGHGLYQQNLPKKYKYQPVGQAKGMAFHESQSLIMEMQAATTHEFLYFISKLLSDEFGLTSSEYSAENLYNKINKVSRSFIRVDADEVTYPLHVILRFEIEKSIIKDNLKASDIPAIWNEKMKEYLGVIPENYAKGCMQDIHWYSGWIGYFPSYSKGAIIASMLMKAAENKHPSIKQDLRTGDFSKLNDYLNENLRSYGSVYSEKELLNKATGKDKVDANIFLNYLKDKYL